MWSCDPITHTHTHETVGMIVSIFRYSLISIETNENNYFIIVLPRYKEKATLLKLRTLADKTYTFNSVQ